MKKIYLLSLLLFITGIKVYSQCSGLSASISSISYITCFGAADGSITVTASGGTTPYDYSIDGGTTFQASNVFNGLSPATYTITVKDDYGCTTTTSTATITQPAAALSLTTTSTNITCSGTDNGTITFTASGGTTAYSYSIDGGTTFQPSNVFYNLAQGSYFLGVKDANGCTTQSIQTITQPNLPSVFVSGSAIFCPGINDTLVAHSSLGGTLNYQWAYSGSLIPAATDTFYVVTVAGSYSVTITDASNCSTTSAPLTVTSSLNASLDRLNDSLFTTVSGGTGSYNYEWMRNNHALPSTNFFYAIDSVGTYNLLITDSHGCSSSLNYTVNSNTVSGLVFDSGYFQNAKVYLLRLNTDSTLQIVDSSTAVGGAYSLSSFYSSVYVYYIPDSSLYPFHLPTYYNSSYNYSVFFENASPINLNTNIGGIDFTDVIGTDSGGIGSINGVITLSSNGQRTTAPNFRTTGINSVSNLKMVLVDSLGNPVQVAVTNSSGNFYFSRLNYGKYQIWIDEPFFANATPPVVTLTTANYNQSGQQFILSSTSLEKISGVTGVNQPTTFSGTINLYPNPVKDILYISIGNQTNGFTYSLNDMTGKIVKSGTGEGFINISGIDKGIYLIKIQSGDSILYSKVAIE